MGGCSVLQFPEVGLSPLPAQPSVTARVSGGFITLSNEGVTCGGSYDAASAAASISAPFECVDGRKGTAAITREANNLSGTGRLRLDDGSEVNFVFGTPGRRVVPVSASSEPATASTSPRAPTTFLPAR
jgi:hypothetical protein